jgi:hypothetical protein
MRQREMRTSTTPQGRIRRLALRHLDHIAALAELCSAGQALTTNGGWCRRRRGIYVHPPGVTALKPTTVVLADRDAGALGEEALLEGATPPGTVADVRQLCAIC